MGGDLDPQNLRQAGPPIWGKTKPRHGEYRGFYGWRLVQRVSNEIADAVDDHAATRRPAHGAKPMRRLHMPAHERELYSSPNGDRWYLVREPETGRLFVRHKANVNLAAPARTARKIHSGEGGVLNRATPLPISGGGWDTGAPLTTKSILRSGLLERAVHSTNQAAGGFSQHGGDNGLATGLTARIPFHARRVSPRSDFPSCACIDEAHL